VPPRTSPLLPPADSAQEVHAESSDRLRHAIDDATHEGKIQLRFEELLDLEQVRRFRDRIGRNGELPSEVQIDISSVRTADGAAIRLLEMELSRLADAGCSVTLHRVSRRLQVQLHLHPILRFADDVDDLFTDPDLEWPGFRHSER
jgi:hypothetical protein